MLGDSGACVMRLAARLKRAAYPRPYEALMYPSAGHVLVGTGWRPTTTDNVDIFRDRGTPEADAHAQAQSWTKMLVVPRPQLPLDRRAPTPTYTFPFHLMLPPSFNSPQSH